MWQTDPIIFEDEDEEKLKADFVRLSAIYPQQSHFEIARYVFRYQRDNELRADQAAMVWSKDIEILERIRKAKLNGGEEPEPPDTKEAKLKILESIYNDPQAKTQDKLKALELHAQMQGEIVKAIDKNITRNAAAAKPQIIYSVYPDE